MFGCWCVGFFDKCVDFVNLFVVGDGWVVVDIVEVGVCFCWCDVECDEVLICCDGGCFIGCSDECLFVEDDVV